MKKINVLVFFFVLALNNSIFLNLQSQIINKILVKVGNSLVTTLDVKNEIITSLILDGQEITQGSIDKSKNFAVKKLVNKLIKKNEVKKYKVSDYNKDDLRNYIESVAKKFNTDTNGLKEIFKKNNINYEKFVENYEIELLWNTLIFQLYKSQTNINIIEVENEIETIKEGKNDDELKLIREKILNKKKEEKLNLFSRSHLSNLENTTSIEFQ